LSLTALQAAVQALVQVNPKHASDVVAALNGLSFELRQLTQLYYLLPEIPVRLKARFAGHTPATYYAILGTAKDFLRGRTAAAAIEARRPSTERRRGTITLSAERRGP
jgi:hypothetical protein